MEYRESDNSSSNFSPSLHKSGSKKKSGMQSKSVDNRSRSLSPPQEEEDRSLKRPIQVVEGLFPNQLQIKKKELPRWDRPISTAAIQKRRISMLQKNRLTSSLSLVGSEESTSTDSNWTNDFSDCFLPSSSNIPNMDSSYDESHYFDSNEAFQSDEIERNVKVEPDLFVIDQAGPSAKRLELAQITIDEVTLKKEMDGLDAVLKEKTTTFKAITNQLNELIFSSSDHSPQEKETIANLAISERHMHREMSLMTEHLSSMLIRIKELADKKNELVASCSSE